MILNTQGILFPFRDCIKAILYIRKVGIIFMSVCRFLAELSKYYCLELHEQKLEDGSWSNLDRFKFFGLVLITIWIKSPDFPIYLLLRVLVEELFSFSPINYFSHTNLSKCLKW